MHALNGKHIPYALNDVNDELYDNDNDDIFYDDDDENYGDDDDDHHHHRHLCHCHHDYHNSHHHRHNHHSCHHHDYCHFHQLFIITFGIRNNIYTKYVISGKWSWRTHTIYA